MTLKIYLTNRDIIVTCRLRCKVDIICFSFGEGASGVSGTMTDELQGTYRESPELFPSFSFPNSVLTIAMSQYLILYPISKQCGHNGR